MELRSLRWRWPLLLLFFSGFCRTEIAPKYTFLKQATEAPAISSYDYIIVGGGTAGCPLAATLSQNFTVLLLERGGSPYGDTNITNLASFGNSLGDLSPTSASQRFVSEDGVINARARVLGGGSCLNAGFYTRASPKYVRRTGWDDGRLVNESYSWVERRVAFQPSMLQWQSAVRDGLLAAGVTPNNGFTFDHLYGTKIGGTIFDRHGNRHTAADLLGYADSKRLTVLLRATVKSILWRRGEGGRPAAKGVVYRDETGRRKRAYVRKGGEVVVAAGAMGSPQLLMLSGVGPREELERLGIKVLVAQPMVGKGMADNPMNAVFVPSPVPVEISLIQVVGITKFGSYIEAASGQLFAASGSGGSSRGSGSHGSGDDRGGGGDPAATNLDIFFPQTRKFPTGPPEQTTPEAITGKDKPAFRGGFIIEKVTGPVSTGHLELRSRNPDDNPAVTFNYFKDRRDLRRCIKGIKTIEKVIQSEPFRKFRFPGISMQALLNLTIQFPVNLRPRHNNDTTSLEQYCKDTVMTIWHYHGGCQVGRVVDRNYRVLGVDALRVIDGSTFNSSPGTNPQATVMMLGRYMGVKILEERLRAKKED